MNTENMTENPSGTADPSATPTSTPEVKYPLRIRGTLIQQTADHDYEFHAQRQTGISSQDPISKTADSKLYRTTGEKKPKMVAHVVVPSDSPDPVADIYEQVDRLTRGLQTKAAPRLRGKLLLNQPDARIVFSRKERKLQMVLNINLNDTPNYQNQLIRLMQQISTCFAINQTSLAPQKS